MICNNCLDCPILYECGGDPKTYFGKYKKVDYSHVDDVKMNVRSN